jgi:MYXO-CTERM domain-containing protein
MHFAAFRLRTLLPAGSVLAGLAALLVPALSGAQPAFPTAQGFGAAATGGRGGAVLHVTTLEASGEGSLAWAVAQPGPRIVVFDVSGVIEGDIEIPHGDITIAGQTAPGAGITIHGHLTTPFGDDVSNLIIRHVRVRPPPADGNWPPEQHDAVQMSTARLILLDHVDVSHGIDENIDFYGGANDITVQWSAITFANPDGGHPEGAHNYCLLNSDNGTNGADGGRISIVQNLFAHCRTRTPALGVGPAEVLNNVIYNGREGFVHHNPAYGDFVIAGNYYKDGPTMTLLPLWFDPENAAPVPTRYYLGENYVDDPGVFEGLFDDPWTTPGFAQEYTFALDSLDPSQFYPLAAAPDWSVEPGYVKPAREPAADALKHVFDCAGAFPRDFLTRRAIEEAQMRTGDHENVPLDDLLAGLTPTSPPVDTDLDGMPDEWESARGLDPLAPDDAQVLQGGYTAIETYLNELADGMVPCMGGPVNPTGSGGGGNGGGGPTGGGPIGGGGAGSVRGDSLGEKGGCGCRAAGDPATAGGALLLALGAGATLVRRRRPR